jgi:hypothetical protein
MGFDTGVCPNSRTPQLVEAHFPNKFGTPKNLGRTLDTENAIAKNIIELYAPLEVGVISPVAGGVTAGSG